MRKHAIDEYADPLATSHATMRRQLITEVAILRQLDHPNIMRLFAFYEDEHCYHLVTELYTGQSLISLVYEG